MVCSDKGYCQGFKKSPDTFSVLFLHLIQETINTALGFRISLYQWWVQHLILVNWQRFFLVSFVFCPYCRLVLGSEVMGFCFEKRCFCTPMNCFNITIRQIVYSPIHCYHFKLLCFRTTYRICFLLEMLKESKKRKKAKRSESVTSSESIFKRFSLKRGNKSKVSSPTVAAQSGWVLSKYKLYVFSWGTCPKIESIVK